MIDGYYFDIPQEDVAKAIQDVIDLQVAEFYFMYFKTPFNND